MKARIHASAAAVILFSACTILSPAQACEPFVGFISPPALVVSMPHPVVHRTPPIIHKEPAVQQPVIEETTKPSTTVESSPKLQGVDYSPFLNNLQNRINGAWSRPWRAKFKPLKVSMKVMKDGEIANVRVLKSSGNKRADKLALKALRDVSPVSSLPPGAPAYANVEFIFESSSGSSCCCGGSACHCTHAGNCGG